MHQRVLLLDTADNLYSAAIQQENYVDPLGLVVSGFLTQSYKPLAAEMTIRNVCQGINKIKHRRDKYHSTMRVWFDSPGACTRAIKLLEDVTDRGKMSKLTEDADAGVMYSCVTHNYHCSFCCVTINVQDILKLVVQKMDFMWETKYLWVDTLAMHLKGNLS